MNNPKQMDEQLNEDGAKNMRENGNFLNQNSQDEDENMVEEQRQSQQMNQNADINQIVDCDEGIKYQNPSSQEQRPGNSNFNNLVKHRQDNSRVTQNIKQKISSKKKDSKHFNFVQGNKSMLNNTNKLSPQNQLNIENIYKKQAERLQYNMIERSPQGSVVGSVVENDRQAIVTRGSGESRRRQVNTSQSQGGQKRQVVTMFNNSDHNVGNWDPKDNNGAVYYGDLNVDQNGQLVDDYQLQGQPDGSGLPNLNLEDAINQGNKDHPKSKNTRRKKLRSMENKPKHNGKFNKSIKSQIREVQEINNAYYRQQFPEFSQSKQLSPKFSGPDTNDGKVIRIGAVLGNVNIITQNNGNQSPENNQNADLPNVNNNGQQPNYTFGEPVKTNQVLSGTDLNDINQQNAYLESDAARYATGTRSKNKSKLKMQPYRRK